MVKKPFDWNAFESNEDACVHCKTEEEATRFTRLMSEHGIVDAVRASTLFLKYGKHKENTVYYSDGCYGSRFYANISGHPISMFDKYDFS